MTDQPPKLNWYGISQTISRSFREEFDLNDEVANDIGFHMTDWLDNLQELRELYLRIDSATNGEINDCVLRFLTHVPPHVYAAAKLSGIGAATDVFGVGIFEDDE